jgi:N-acetylglucosaminyl-diphospho-decaprenol L-rhamnosyltransferase
MAFAALAPERLRFETGEGEDNYDLDLTIIIVSYNTRQLTVDCIHSIRSSTADTSYEIIVFDNASNDGSVEALRAIFPDLKLIASSKNIGFASANNMAEIHARGRRLLLLNPDTLILDHAIDELNGFAIANPHCGIWGGRGIHPDGTLDWTCRRRKTFWSTFCFALGLSLLFNHPQEYHSWNHDTVRRVDVIDGCFLLVDRFLWKRLGGFDSSFFMYGEDDDLCLRAQRLGAEPTFTPTATVIHYGAASDADEAEKRIKLIAGEITLMKRWSVLSAFGGRLMYLIAPHPRWMIYGVMGLVTRSARLQNKAAMWLKVWQCRRLWMNGWLQGVNFDQSHPQLVRYSCD